MKKIFIALSLFFVVVLRMGGVYLEQSLIEDNFT